MKIDYIINVRIPTEKAHGYQISEMCRQFSNHGMICRLIIPNIFNDIKLDLFNFYGFNKNFEVLKINCFDFSKYYNQKNGLFYYLQSLFFIFSLLFSYDWSSDWVMTRDPLIVFVSKLKNKRVIFESHNIPLRNYIIFKFLTHRADIFLSNSMGTAKAVGTLLKKDVVSLPNGVDLDAFVLSSSTKLKLELFNLPPDKKIILYCGHFYKWKGIDVIIEAAEYSKRADLFFVLIGGSDIDVEKYKKIAVAKHLQNIIFLGYQKKSRIPQYLMSADILLLPNTPISEESIKYTSPIKMFEYMASGVPILASNLPSLKEILNDNNCFFFKAGDSVNLLTMIDFIFSDYKKSLLKSERAIDDVKQYSWNNRAGKILELISKI